MTRPVDDDDPLALTLGSIYAAAPAPPPPSLDLQPTQSPARRRRLNDGSVDRRSSSDEVPPPLPEGVVMGELLRRSRSSRSSDEAPQSEGVVMGGRPAAAPFPWATEQPARHETLRNLLLRGITSVEGEMFCKNCGGKVAVAYDLEAKFREVRDFIAANEADMNDRAPEAWLRPALPDCAVCGESSKMLPVIPAENSEINWLFLLLGQMLGCCKLEQLKYFCRNTGRHRTGAKNRVLYYTYLEMCNQLQP